MRRAGYDDGVSSAVRPPLPAWDNHSSQHSFIIYGVIAQVSIGAFSLRESCPGFCSAVPMIYMVIVARRDGYPREPRASMRDVFTGTLRRCVPGDARHHHRGHLGRHLYAHEGGGHRRRVRLRGWVFCLPRLKLSVVPPSSDIGVEAAVVMLLLGLSSPSLVVAVEQVPMKVMETLAYSLRPPMLFLILVNIFLLIIGILWKRPGPHIVTPVLVPLADRMGIDPCISA